jgi:hypothetical protein
MTQSEYGARIMSIMDAEYKAIDGDDFRAKFGDEMVKKIITERLAKQLEALVESDPEFKEAYIHNIATRYVKQYEVDKRPTGAYREDGVLPLSENDRVFMSHATRAHLLAWALHEDDERNLAYIRSRLDLWNKHPECKNLKELEEVADGN